MARRDTNTRVATRLRPELTRPDMTPGARKCRRRFLKFFPAGFRDETYVDWERDYKWEAYEKWCASLRRGSFRSQLDSGEYAAIAKHAVSIESRTNLLFSFEKMALRDAVKTPAGARMFAEGLWDFLHGAGTDQARFERWIEVVAALPRVQTRVLTWPIATVFGFIAQPERHIFLKPNVTKRAAAAYGFPFEYASRPNWKTYVNLVEFAEQVREDQRDLGPRDMMDLQGFIWVQGSDEYD
ncbi:MAG TPA: hypothetical protein VKH19_02530 [Gemmatimonadaceae bacterium]|nr:hypothetical protein [Gemmatimonadaceae bacterium]